MRHAIKLGAEDKIKIWLDLCDFSFRLMRNSIDKKTLEKRLRRLNEENIKSRAAFLTALAKAYS